MYKLISSTDSANVPHIPIKKWQKDLNIHTDNNVWNKTFNKIFIMYQNANI